MKRNLSKMTCIEDLRRVAKRKVPKMFYDYVASGSWTETTLRENSSDFDPIKFRQRVLVNMEGRSLATKMIGQDVHMPLAIAPTGFTGMMHADGEILAARAAAVPPARPAAQRHAHAAPPAAGLRTRGSMPRRLRARVAPIQRR